MGVAVSYGRWGRLNIGQTHAGGRVVHAPPVGCCLVGPIAATGGQGSATKRTRRPSGLLRAYRQGQNVVLGTPLVGPLGRSPLGFCRGLRQGCPLAAQGKSADHSLAQGISARSTRHGTHWSLCSIRGRFLSLRAYWRGRTSSIRASAIRLMGVAEGATTTRPGTHGSSGAVKWASPILWSGRIPTTRGRWRMSFRRVGRCSSGPPVQTGPFSTTRLRLGGVHQAVQVFSPRA